MIILAVAAANLRASTSITPSNESTLIEPSTNATTGRTDLWPLLPLFYPIKDALSAVVIEYGELVPQSQEEVILAALAGIETNISSSGGPQDFFNREIISNGPVMVSFQRRIEPTVPFRLSEAAMMVNAISRLMYIYEPRALAQVKVMSGAELLLQVRVLIFSRLGESTALPLRSPPNRSITVSSNLIARGKPSSKWPTTPCTILISDDLKMTIFGYGRPFIFTREVVLQSLAQIHDMIAERWRVDERLPNIELEAGPIAVKFTKVSFPPVTLTGFQAAQVIHTIWHLTTERPPRGFTMAEIYVVGQAAMLFSFGLRGNIGRNETSLQNLSAPLNRLGPAALEIVARDNPNRGGNTALDKDQDWPPLPYTVNVEDYLYVNILGYGVNFPGARRDVVQALTTVSAILTGRGQPSDIIRAQRLSVSPVSVALYRTDQRAGAPLTRAQAALVIRAMEGLMKRHKPREFTSAEVYVDGKKSLDIRLELYFADLGSGHTNLDIGSVPIQR